MEHNRPKRKPTGDYEVGYARPPKSGQYQKGQSGNPRGRPKRNFTSNLCEAADEALAEIVVVPFRGKLKRMTLAEASMCKAAIAAASGDAQARRDLIRLQQQSRESRHTEGWTVIHARPVFDNEENRLTELAQENRQLREELERLRHALPRANDRP